MKISISQLNPIDIYRLLCPTTAEYKFYAHTSGIFPRIHHILGHKTNNNALEVIKIIHNMFSVTELNQKTLTKKITKFPLNT